MRIPQEWLESIVYLYPDEASAQRGERIGGSGFVMGKPLGIDGLLSLWVVTNKHVIEQGNWSIRVNTKDGGFEVIETNDKEWFLHPNGSDLAVRPISLKLDIHRAKCVPTDMLLSKERFAFYDIGPGDLCFVIGRFINHEGKQQNAPTVRFGQVAQMPVDKVRVGTVEQESFLVEIRSIGGYSGSPVYVHLESLSNRHRKYNDSFETTIRKPGFDWQSHGPWLLGVDWCMVPMWEQVCDQTGRQLPNGWVVPSNTGMMGVVPSWDLYYLLMEHPPIVAHCEMIKAAELLRQNSLPSVVTS